jgi:IS5 family transposase
MGNPLESISNVIEFEMFRSLLEAKLQNKSKKNNAVAKPLDFVLLFKIILLQREYGLGEKQVQSQIIDRARLKRFLGVETSN